MSLRIYMDVHVPQAITDGLRRRGVNVLTAQEDNAERASDPEILDRAGAQGRVLFTRDEDLLAEASQRQALQRRFCGIIYAHQLRVSIGQCVTDIELIAKVYALEDIADRVEHLPLR